MSHEIHDNFSRVYSNNSSYYLSSKGYIKEAGVLQKIKCLLNIGDARKKVRDLIPMVKKHLLMKIGNQYNRELDNQLNALDTTSNISGSRLNEIIRNFRMSSTKNIDIYNARMVIEECANSYTQSLTDYITDNSEGILKDIFVSSVNHLKKNIPYTKRLNDEGREIEVFDENKFRNDISEVMKGLKDEIMNLGIRKFNEPIDPLYLYYMKSKLFDPKTGNRNNVKISELKDLNGAKKDYILQCVGIDKFDKAETKTQIEKRADLIIEKTSGNQALTVNALKYSHRLMISSAGKFRSEDETLKMIEGLRSNLEEIDNLDLRYTSGIRTIGLEVMNILEGNSFPEGVLTSLVRSAFNQDVSFLNNLTEQSSPFEIHNVIIRLQELTRDALLEASKDNKNIYNEITSAPELLEGAKMIFQDILLLKLSPQQRTELRNIHSGLNYAKLVNMYNHIEKSGNLYSDLGRDNRALNNALKGITSPVLSLISTVCCDVVRASFILKDNLNYFSNNYKDDSVKYNSVADFEADGFYDVLNSIKAQALDYANKSVELLNSSSFTGNGAEPVKAMIKGKILRTEYVDNNNDTFNAAGCLNNLSLNNVVKAVNDSALQNYLQLNSANADFENGELPSVLKNIKSGLVIKLAGKDLESSEPLKVCDEIARFVLKNNDISYSTLDEDSRKKVNLVLSLLSESTASGVTDGLRKSFSSGGVKDDTFAKDVTKAVTEYNLSIRGDTLEIAMTSRKNINGVVIGNNTHNLDPGKSYVETSLTYSLRENEQYSDYTDVLDGKIGPDSTLIKADHLLSSLKGNFEL